MRYWHGVKETDKLEIQKTIYSEKNIGIYVLRQKIVQFKKRHKIVPRPFPENQPKTPYFCNGTCRRPYYSFLYNYLVYYFKIFNSKLTTQPCLFVLYTQSRRLQTKKTRGNDKLSEISNELLILKRVFMSLKLYYSQTKPKFATLEKKKKKSVTVIEISCG